MMRNDSPVGRAANVASTRAYCSCVESNRKSNSANMIRPRSFSKAVQCHEEDGGRFLNAVLSPPTVAALLRAMNALGPRVFDVTTRLSKGLYGTVRDRTSTLAA